MKKAILLLTGFAVAGLIACGPSAEEQKKLEQQLKAAADSAANELLKQASASASDTTMHKDTTAKADTTKKK
ncbi:MAG TPA: hypothetical protein VII99_14410 [Bacteroidia bacterium]